MLTDGVVSLSPLASADAELVLQWDADPEIQRWFDWPVTPAVDDAATLGARRAGAERSIVAKRQRWAEGTEFVFAVRSAVTGEGYGWIDLQPRGTGIGNVAYGVLTRYRGRGLASRGVRLAARYAFETFGWARLEIRANAQNLASLAVAKKAGFHCECVSQNDGLMQHHQPSLGQSYDTALYYRLRDDV